jgi:hypothetical protein
MGLGKYFSLKRFPYVKILKSTALGEKNECKSLLKFSKELFLSHFHP